MYIFNGWVGDYNCYKNLSKQMNYQIGEIKFIIGEQTEIYGNFHQFLREGNLHEKTFDNIGSLSKVIKPAELNIILNLPKYRNPVTGLILVEQKKIAKEFNVSNSTIEKYFYKLKNSFKCPYCDFQIPFIYQFKYAVTGRPNKNAYGLDYFCQFLEHIENHKR